MDNKELQERLEVIIGYLEEDNRDSADTELYAIFDDLEFISDDYNDEDDEYDEDDNEDEE
jgi:hypothetical protein